MKGSVVLAGILAVAGATLAARAVIGLPEEGAKTTGPNLAVKACDDFEVDGKGSAEAWSRAEWTPLVKRAGAGHDYDARFKVLHSRTGLYFLMEGSDSELTASFAEDFQDLWTEDVFEVFLQPDERHPLYFEYEISPLGKELPILIPNIDGKFLGWRPWHYDGPRRTRLATTVDGGEKKTGARIDRWRAEFFVPYELLKPMANVPPRAGSRWRANFYRVDHDRGKKTGWHWAPVGPSFHEFERFGVLTFE